MSDRIVKRQRVLDILDRAGRDAIWLTSATALSWYLEGARVHTSLLGAPIAALRVDRDGDHLRVYSNEAERIIAEELPSGLDIETVTWHQPLIPDHDAPEVIAEESVAAELRAARAQLLPAERERYRVLGRETAAALTTRLSLARPDETELSLAARVSQALVAIGADPAVVMVAGESRLRHRHPLPTHAPLGSRAMVVVCARRQGLIANVTRWIRFGAADAASVERESAIRAVEADAFRATRAGRPLGDVLAEIAASYPRHGFASDEWTRHHQGGAAGYAGRDPRATPGALDLVQDGQAFAWNPTAPGHKIEDTVLVDGDQITVVTRDGEWPEITVDGIPRPLELSL